MGPPDLLIAVAAIAGVFVVALLAVGVALWRLLHVVRPNEVLVVMGRRRRLADGRVVGYRIVTAGRALRLPFLERVERLDTTSLTVALERMSVVSRDNLRATLSATATVKSPRAEDDLANYVEAFLGRSPEDVVQAARRALEGHVRSVAGQYTAAELDAHREKLGEQVRQAARDELAKMGLLAEELVIRAVVVEQEAAAKPAPAAPALPPAAEAPVLPPAAKAPAPAADPFAIQGALPALGPSGAIGADGKSSPGR